MLSDNKGNRLTKYVKDYCVFDLETTGISTKKDRVAEISAIKVRDGKVVDEFTSLVNPEMPISLHASEVNNITDDMVANSPTFDTVLKDFVDFIEDLPLVGHNIHSFDLPIIYRDLSLYYASSIDNDYIDTLHLARTVLPNLAHHTLSDLAIHYGIDTEGAHRALFDCKMNQQIYEKMGEEMKKDDNPDIQKCPVCGNLLKVRNGKFGEFWGCSGYPLCRFTKNV